VCGGIVFYIPTSGKMEKTCVYVCACVRMGKDRKRENRQNRHKIKTLPQIITAENHLTKLVHPPPEFND